MWLVLGRGGELSYGKLQPKHTRPCPSGSVVLNAQGQVKRLSPGEQPAASDVVISFDTSETSVPSVSALVVDNQGQQNVLDTDDAIAQEVQRAIEEGFDQRN
ncbi:hypothetical protein O9992_16610 [Vibrio lentus]|nr:hypothetical protein [Vibrio lentus]